MKPISGESICKITEKPCKKISMCKYCSIAIEYFKNKDVKYADTKNI
jgi:hypothetical protein